MDLTFQDIGWLLFAMIIVVGVGPLARWLWHNSDIIRFVFVGANAAESVNTFEDTPASAQCSIMSNIPVSAPLDTGIIPGNTTAQEGAPERDLTEREGVQWLAKKKKADNWAMSVNQIYNIAGGNRNVVLEWIREARQEHAAPPDDYTTPIAGRPTNARYYYDDPELEYKAPAV